MRDAISEIYSIIDLVVKEYVCVHLIGGDAEFVKRFAPQITHHMCGEILIRFKARFPSEEILAVCWPKDWWQAFRERWFPDGWLNKYPVVYKHVNIDAVYDKISVPEYKPRIFITRRTKPEWPKLST